MSVRLLVLAALAAAGCTHHGAMPTAAELTRLEAAAHVTFPPSMRVVYWESGGRQDEHDALKFTLPKGDLPAFLAASPFAGHPFDPLMAGQLGTDHDAWDPHRVTPGRSGQVMLPGAKALNVGVDESRVDPVTVYLVYFGT